MSATQNAGTVDAAEIARFEAMAAEWWDPEGKFKPLHMLNPCRLGYVVDQIAAEFGRDPKARQPFAGLRLLDIGCGGGLLSEPMARLGAADFKDGMLQVHLPKSVKAKPKAIEINVG